MGKSRAEGTLQAPFSVLCCFYETFSLSATLNSKASCVGYVPYMPLTNLLEDPRGLGLGIYEHPSTQWRAESTCPPRTTSSEQQQPRGGYCIYGQYDTKLEAKHTFHRSRLRGLEAHYRGTTGNSRNKIRGAWLSCPANFSVWPDYDARRKSSVRFSVASRGLGTTQSYNLFE